MFILPPVVSAPDRLDCRVLVAPELVTPMRRFLDENAQQVAIVGSKYTVFRMDPTVGERYIHALRRNNQIPPPDRQAHSAMNSPRTFPTFVVADTTGRLASYATGRLVGRAVDFSVAVPVPHPYLHVAGIGLVQFLRHALQEHHVFTVMTNNMQSLQTGIKPTRFFKAAQHVGYTIVRATGDGTVFGSEIYALNKDFFAPLGICEGTHWEALQLRLDFFADFQGSVDDFAGLRVVTLVGPEAAYYVSGVPAVDKSAWPQLKVSGWNWARQFVRDAVSYKFDVSFAHADTSGILRGAFGGEIEGRTLKCVRRVTDPAKNVDDTVDIMLALASAAHKYAESKGLDFNLLA